MNRPGVASGGFGYLAVRDCELVMFKNPQLVAEWVEQSKHEYMGESQRESYVEWIRNEKVLRPSLYH